MKRTFEVEVTRVDRYTIEIDESVMNEEWMEEFRGFFYDFEDAEEHAKHIAQFRARFNNDNLYGGFVEGYGDIALGGKILPSSKHPFPAVNIAKADEDYDIEIEIMEV